LRFRGADGPVRACGDELILILKLEATRQGLYPDIELQVRVAPHRSGKVRRRRDIKGERPLDFRRSREGGDPPRGAGNKMHHWESRPLWAAHVAVGCPSRLLVSIQAPSRCEQPHAEGVFARVVGTPEAATVWPLLLPDEDQVRHGGRKLSQLFPP